MKKEALKALLHQLVNSYVEDAWEEEDEPEKLTTGERVEDFIEYLTVLKVTLEMTDEDTTER